MVKLYTIEITSKSSGRRLLTLTKNRWITEAEWLAQFTTTGECSNEGKGQPFPEAQQNPTAPSKTFADNIRLCMQSFSTLGPAASPSPSPKTKATMKTSPSLSLWTLITIMMLALSSGVASMPLDQAPRDLTTPATNTAAATFAARDSGEENTEDDTDSCCNGTDPRNRIECFASATNSAQANYEGCTSSGGSCYYGVLSGGYNVYCSNCQCVI